MATATERRARFADDARTANTEWKFFDALRLPQSPLRVDEERCLVETGRPLRPGEIGCYASHYELWRWFVASDFDQLVVLEDDVIVDWQALGALVKEDLSVAGVHVLKLFATHPPRARVVRYKLFSDHSHLLRTEGYTYGTQAYLLTRTGAKALIDSCSRVAMPIDWAMSRYWDYGLVNYCVFPFPVLERLGRSTIEHSLDASPALAPTYRLRRLQWRLRSRLSRWWTDVRQPRTAFGPLNDARAAMFSPPGHSFGTAERPSLPLRPSDETLNRP